MGWVRREMQSHRESLEAALDRHGDIYRWSREHGINNRASFSAFKRELLDEYGVDYDALRGQADRFKTERLQEAVERSLRLPVAIPADAEYRWKVFGQVKPDAAGVAWLSDWFGDTRYVGGHPMVATCLTHPHDAPGPDCSCGIWAFDDLDRCDRLPRRAGYYPLLVGRVAQWGRCFPADGAMRSEFAYPVILYTDLDVRWPGAGQFCEVQPLSPLLEEVDLGFCPGCSRILGREKLQPFKSLNREFFLGFGRINACERCIKMRCV